MPFDCRYTRHRSQLASPFAAALLSIHMGLAKAETAAMFMVSHGTRGGAGGMVGTLHESLTHIFLAAGGEFECRLITSGKEFTLRLPQSTDVEVRWIAAQQHADLGLTEEQGSFGGVASGLVWQHVLNYIALGPHRIASRWLCSRILALVVAGALPMPLSCRYTRSQPGDAWEQTRLQR